MNNKNWKRVLVLMFMLFGAFLYIKSHVENDYEMVKTIKKQERQIHLMKSYIKILETGKSGKWVRCI